MPSDIHHPPKSRADYQKDYRDRKRAEAEDLRRLLENPLTNNSTTFLAILDELRGIRLALTGGAPQAPAAPLATPRPSEASQLITTYQAFPTAPKLTALPPVETMVFIKGNIPGCTHPEPKPQESESGKHRYFCPTCSARTEWLELSK